MSIPTCRHVGEFCTAQEPAGPADRFTRSQDTTGRGEVVQHLGRAPYVKLSLYPSCGEAVACVVVPQADADPEAPPVPPEPTDPEANWRRANARAKARSRRYMVHNRLRYMWVLTMSGDGLHGPDGRRELMAHMHSFIRRFRADVGEMPYWYSPELHPGGHGWHCNVFLPKRVPHDQVKRLWGHGHVWVSDWSTDRRHPDRSFIERLRAGAAYGAKYASKDWDDEMLAGGAHRYERAQGFDPPVVEVELWTVEAAHRLAVAHLGRPVRIWRSDDDPTWDGPRCVTLAFATARRSSG